MSSAKVPTASTAPVRLKSCCVTPCWTRSPMVTNSSSSKAVSSPSVERPTARVISHRKKNTMTARMTISIDPPQGASHVR